MIVNISGLYAIRVAPAALLSAVYGVVGAWMAMFLDVWIRGIAMLVVFHKRFVKLSRKVI